jgi:hypothetical protein
MVLLSKVAEAQKSIRVVNLITKLTNYHSKKAKSQSQIKTNFIFLIPLHIVELLYHTPAVIFGKLCTLFLGTGKR